MRTSIVFLHVIIFFAASTASYDHENGECCHTPADSVSNCFSLSTHILSLVRKSSQLAIDDEGFSPALGRIISCNVFLVLFLWHGPRLVLDVCSICMIPFLVGESRLLYLFSGGAKSRSGCKAEWTCDGAPPLSSCGKWKDRDRKIWDCICDYHHATENALIRTCWANDACTNLRRTCIYDSNCFEGEVCVNHCCNGARRTCTRVCPQGDPNMEYRLQGLDEPCVNTALRRCP